MSIEIKPSHKGLLHKDMGIAAGKPIPTKSLTKAAKSADPAEKKRIVFAENARKWNHPKKMSKGGLSEHGSTHYCVGGTVVD